jgi:membrane protease YdiL (CAAX protease family)
VPLEENAFVLGVITLIATGIVLHRVLKKTDGNFDDLCPLIPIQAMLLLPMVSVLIGLGLVISEIENVVRLFMPVPESFNRMFNNLVGKEGPLWPVLFYAAFIAPLTEELLFRGIILYGLLQNYSVKKAVVVSALLFGVIHLNPWQFPAAFVLGIVFAWWVMQTGSLWPAILGHMFHNALSVLVSHLAILGMSNELTGAVVFNPWWLNALGFALAIWGLRRFYQLTCDNGLQTIREKDYPDQTMEREGV